MLMTWWCRSQCLLIILLLDISRWLSRNVSIHWQHGLSKMCNGLVGLLTVLHHQSSPLRCWHIDTAHQLRLCVKERRATNNVLLMLRRVIGFSGLTTSLMIDTYIWIGFIKLVDRLCVVTKIWWMELWVLTWLVTCWLMGVITHIAWCLICLLLISVLLTVSTTMTVSAASWQLHTAAIFRIAFCIVRYSYG